VTRRGTLAAVALVVGLAAVAAVSRDRLIALDRTRPADGSMLYLPNGRFLEVASLGQTSLAASAVYLWAIQYYSDYDRADRYRWVEHVFRNVIARLDPHYVDPYWIGALILSVEAQDLDGALRLLEDGIRNNPDNWILAYLAGWECERAGQHKRAADYFDRAAAVPGAPPKLLRLRAGMMTRAGDLQEALRRWKEVLDDPRSDESSRAIASRQIRDLTIRVDLSAIDDAVAAYRRIHGANPRRLEDLVRAGLLDRVPLDPDGDPYVLDRATGEGTTRASRVLGGS
jgi:tetratricopeptide (TPR) repeat protein